MPADEFIINLALAALDADHQMRELLTEPGTGRRVAFPLLYTYATNVAFVPPADFSARLADDPRAAADLQRLIANRAFSHVSSLAAAASGKVLRRETAEAVLTLTPSRANPAHVYLRIELVDAAVQAPAQLFVHASDGTWHKLPLPAFTEAAAQILLEADGAIARALSDIAAEAYLC